MGGGIGMGKSLRYFLVAAKYKFMIVQYPSQGRFMSCFQEDRKESYSHTSYFSSSSTGFKTKGHET